MKKSFLILLSISFFLLSCVPGRRTSIEILSPAVFSFPSETEDVLVFNASFLPSAEQSQNSFLAELSQGEQYIVDTIVNTNVFNGLFSVFDSSPVGYLNSADYYEERGTGSESELVLDPFTEEAIYALCESFNVDAVIAFEYYGIVMGVNTATRTNGEDYYRVAQLILHRTMLWRIYNNKGAMLNEDLKTDTLYWYGTGGSTAEARADLPEITHIIREAFWYGGYDYAKQIAPTWTEDYRYYFDIKLKDQNISMDTLALKKLAEGNNKIRAYKASYNLAVYYEVNDQPETALNWIKRAVYLRPDASSARYYKNQLEDRVKKAKILDEQLNVNMDQNV